MTPFEAVYGRKAPGIQDYITGQSVPATVESTLLHRDHLLKTLRTNMGRAQARMQHQANAHKKDKTFDVGDWVFIRLQPYRQILVQSLHSHKHAKHFYGPFEVTGRIGSVAYQVALPPHAKIHNVFHISLLRKCMEPALAKVCALPATFENLLPAPRLEEVLSFFRVRTGPIWTTQLLIRWEGQSNATWETMQSILTEFPSFDLEAKVVLDQGGHVRGLKPQTETTTAAQQTTRTESTATLDRGERRRSKRAVHSSKRYPETTFVR
ncbi:unnamed protein product [Rhodiola kirilowii]